MTAPDAEPLLADPAELAVRTGRAPDDPALLYALRSASRAFVDAVGHPVVLVQDEEIVLDGHGGTVLLLPAAPVTAVSSVSVDGAAVTDWQWSADGYLERESGWPRRLRSVRVVYSHGYDPIPGGIADAVLQHAEMGLTVPVGLASMTVGGETVSFANSSGASVVGVTSLWSSVVRRYTVGRGDRPWP